MDKFTPEEFMKVVRYVEGQDVRVLIEKGYLNFRAIVDGEVNKRTAVILIGVGEGRKIHVIKLARVWSNNIGLAEAKAFTDNVPSVWPIEYESEASAQEFVDALRAENCSVWMGPASQVDSVLARLAEERRG